ncbi:Fe-S cluster assembly protein SufD [Leucobacter luti]|uniref:Iron-regulated ABC transporter permease protein SufD n=1 Tax=Leucobacter luti TaxID=340320 RepID=A0A4Q7TK39_9MICO|nr:Fe-S cluster assembly protein SufD [Leucobacter luti]MBL3700290.1 Fe-S cluster assembly protein SufD [Leucobacter luti]RZT60986.1 iron-regulated ABC transporter permease protein SufD [Leucobacter luti]
MTTLQTEQHGAKAHTDGDWANRAPVQTRSDRLKSAEIADFPAVTGREVNWKYTPVAEIASLIDGTLEAATSALEISEAAGVQVDSVQMDSELVGRGGLPEDRAAANAWGQVGTAQRITLTSAERQTVIVKRSALTTNPTAAHTIIEAAPQSDTVVILENTGTANLTETVEIIVGEGANLKVVSVQEWNDDAIHVASHNAVVARDGNLQHIVVSLGGKIVRVNPSIHLDGQGANGEAYGAYFADAGQHLEHQVYIDHNAPNTRSRVAYKGALQGEGAHAVWIGDVLIRRVAAGTDSYEENRNLTLTEGTRADSIPNLEIETGDIAGAGHASTTGRFDEEHIFYLQSRGISEDEARKLVVRGFLFDVIQRIGNEQIEERLQAAIDAELQQSVLA